MQACCHFSLIFSHLLQLKKEADILILLPILSANYISGRSHGLPWWPSGIYAWIFSRKKELERKWRKRLWIFGSLTDILIMVVPIKIYDSDNLVYTYGTAVIITYAVTVILLALILMLTKKYSQAINPRRRKSMQVWVALMFISAVIQFIDKKILIVSFASVIGVLILFIMLENPMANIDRDTGFFNLNAPF